MIVGPKMLASSSGVCHDDNKIGEFVQITV